MSDLIQEEYRAHEDRLRAWVETAEAELTAEEPRQQVYGLLFWAQAEFHRRRVYLGQDMPELERRAAELPRTLGDTKPGEPVSNVRIRYSRALYCLPAGNPL